MPLSRARSGVRRRARLLGRQPLARRHLLGPLGQAFGAEQLAPDGPGKAVLAGVRADERHEEGEGAAELSGGWPNLRGRSVVEARVMGRGIGQYNDGLGGAVRR